MHPRGLPERPFRPKPLVALPPTAPVVPAPAPGGGGDGGGGGGSGGLPDPADEGGIQLTSLHASDFRLEVPALPSGPPATANADVDNAESTKDVDSAESAPRGAVAEVPANAESPLSHANLAAAAGPEALAAAHDSAQCDSTPAAVVASRVPSSEALAAYPSTAPTPPSVPEPADPAPASPPPKKKKKKKHKKPKRIRSIGELGTYSLLQSCGGREEDNPQS